MQALRLLCLSLLCLAIDSNAGGLSITPWHPDTTGQALRAARKADAVVTPIWFGPQLGMDALGRSDWDDTLPDAIRDNTGYQFMVVGHSPGRGALGRWFEAGFTHWAFAPDYFPGAIPFSGSSPRGFRPYAFDAFAWHVGYEWPARTGRFEWGFLSAGIGASYGELGRSVQGFASHTFTVAPEALLRAGVRVPAGADRRLVLAVSGTTRWLLMDNDNGGIYPVTLSVSSESRLTFSRRFLDTH